MENPDPTSSKRRSPVMFMAGFPEFTLLDAVQLDGGVRGRQPPLALVTDSWNLGTSAGSLRRNAMDMRCTSTGKVFYQIDSQIAALLIEALPTVFEKVDTPERLGLGQYCQSGDTLRVRC
jgi:hypothetical protein